MRSGPDCRGRARISGLWAISARLGPTSGHFTSQLSGSKSYAAGKLVKARSNEEDGFVSGGDVLSQLNGQGLAFRHLSKPAWKN